MSKIYLNYLLEPGAVWFNPCYGINGFWNELRLLQSKMPDKDFQTIWSHRDLQSAKEILATSIVAKATQMQNSDQKWWIQKPKQDPPDGVMGTIFNTDGYDKMHVREVEVVECVNGDILETIKNKLLKKRYEPNTVLVCYLSGASGLYDFEKMSQEILAEETSLDHVFLVFMGALASEIKTKGTTREMAQSLFKYSSVQLKPVFSVQTIDPISDCKKWLNGEDGNFFIFEGRGKGGMRPVKFDEPPKLF
jgi:hypothetical protein